MKLLIITQKVDKNDPILGFFHQWLIEFAKHVEKVFVVCLYEGAHDLPKNIEIFSLGKEEGVSRLEYVIRFYNFLWRLRGQYDGVFVHMNQIYVLLGGIFWRISGVPVGLWYAHRAKTFSLWLAEKFTNVIFTNTQKSFTLSSEKIIALGHGIDIEATARPADYSEIRERRALLCVGRLTPIKDQETIIRACGILSREGVDFTCTFIGGPTAIGDKSYNEGLRRLVLDEGVDKKILFKGGLSQMEVFPYYWKSAIHINACPTGGMDKVVLEAAVGGAIPVVTNESFRAFLGDYASKLIFRTGDAESLAECIKNLLESSDQEIIRATLEKKARENFDLTILVKKIINWYETSR